ncbi:lipopolysaccharide assembly protein LapA domain-containing protein [Bartonella rattaustraliani]|uniref:lipopolysaccharide assembly protein LapA domain-containing protein n=1 Tax=Bartonella rattaustraliani TaxID=481139 RepID=UPI0004763DB8|nr:lipopolysaccharide assembly protein LapA domain-containing protein [Bartonella rattaustraliani]
MVIKHVLLVIIAIILTVFLVVFIIANHQMVTLTLNPFGISSKNFTYNAPFFIWLFIFLGFGVLLGNLTNWFAYYKCKKTLKKSKDELEKLKMSITNMVE